MTEDFLKSTLPRRVQGVQGVYHTVASCASRSSKRTLEASFTMFVGVRLPGRNLRVVTYKQLEGF